MFFKRCPRADVLQLLVKDNQATEKVRRHVVKCETCSRIVSDLRKGARIGDTFREAVHNFDDDTRNRALKSCDKIISSQRGGRRRT